MMSTFQSRELSLVEVKRPTPNCCSRAILIPKAIEQSFINSSGMDSRVFICSVVQCACLLSIYSAVGMWEIKVATT